MTSPLDMYILDDSEIFNFKKEIGIEELSNN